jgi:hypothetical protein
MDWICSTNTKRFEWIAIALSREENVYRQKRSKSKSLAHLVDLMERVLQREFDCGFSLETGYI